MLRSVASRLPPNSKGVSPALFLVLVASLALTVAHHVDHLIRGNHVGWPVTPEVNAFTYSLAIYPLVLVGLYLTLTDRAGVGYWSVVMTVGAAMLTFVHLGPWAMEPPADVIGPYASFVAGIGALAVLLALVVVVNLGAGVSIVTWWRRRAE